MSRCEQGSSDLRSIVVVGGGVVARTVALAFARAVPRLHVTLIPAPVAPDALADWFPTLLASGRGAPALWGTSAEELLVQGIATPRLAAAFTAWPTRETWLDPEGLPIALPGRGEMHTRWLRAYDVPRRPRFDALFPATAMLRANSFAIEPLPPLAAADYGLYFDPRRLAEWLSRVIVAANVVVARAKHAATMHEADGAVAAVRTEDGVAFEADLYIDASGPAALLGHLSATRDDWSRMLKVDRLTVAIDQEPIALQDRYQRHRSGFVARWPFPRRPIRATAYEARASRAALPTPDPAASAPIALRPGRRRELWHRNCIAVGEAGVQPGALRLTGFTLAQAQLETALALLPPRDMPPVLVAEYNRRCGERADRLRDWLMAHDLPRCPRLPGECPDTLAATLRRFARNGGLPHRDGESVPNAAWHSIMIGQGWQPHHVPPPAANDDPVMFVSMAQQAAALMSHAAASLPPFAETST